MGRAILGVPFMRRWYARRLLKMMDKAKAKNRQLPPELAQLEANLSRLPKARRFEALETALSAGGGDQALSREMRRAAGRQGRQSGRGGARQRPGQPVYPVRPKRPKPR